MTGATAEFFEQLAERGPDPLLEKARGTVRLEIVEGKRVDPVLLRIDRGEIDVSPGGGPADLTLRADRQTFEGIARGTTNPVTAIMRGAMTIDGDWGLAVLLQRVFPSPPRRGRRSNGKTDRGRKA
jgi:putative sterol carrier protein